MPVPTFSRMGRMPAVFFSVVTVALGMAAAQESAVRLPLVPDARSGNLIDWRYTTEEPQGSDWTDSAFDDAGWTTGPGGFGSGDLQNARLGTGWTTGSIWLRKEFTLPDLPVQSLILSLHHDEDAEIYLNGQLVYQESGWVTDYAEFYLASDYNNAVRPGRNVLAVVCHNTDGPGYIDVGLAADFGLQAETLVSDARSFPTEWSYMTSDPGSGWYESGFDASSWNVGRAGFGAGDIYAPTTAWQESDIWMRTTFNAAAVSDLYQLSYMHDDDLEIYLNGTLVSQQSGFTSGYKDEVSDAVKQAIKTGDNVLAVHCANTGTGPQFVDLGLKALSNPVPTRLAKRASARLGGMGPALHAGAGLIDVSALARDDGGRLEIFDLGGSRVGSFRAGKGARALAAPALKAAGTFRYRWTGPRGARQGMLIGLP